MGWMDQMKPSDWINLGQLGTSVIGGVASGKASERAAENDFFTQQQRARQEEFDRQLQMYQLQQQARSGLGAFYNQTNMDRASGRQALLNSAPLGAEQEFVAKMALGRGLMGVMDNFQPAMPTSADIASLIRPTGNVLSAFTTPDMQAAYSNMATARSLAERRKAQAGVDPNFQFGSMGDYGLPSLDKEVATYAQGVAADRLSRENLLQDLLVQQAKAATAFPQTAASATAPTGVPPMATTTQAPAKKKSPWWKKVLNVAAAAAPIVAAPFTGGTSLALIGAGSGALRGALNGGAKGALLGAATGAATSAIGGGAAGAAAARGASGAAKEAAGAAIKRAILNPRALTTLGGAAIGGRVEQATQALAPFLPGAKAFNPGIVAGFENQMPPGWQGPQQPLVGPGAEGFSTEFTSPPPGSGTTFTPMQPRRGSVTPPTMGLSPNLIQQRPSVTPRLTATKLSPDLQQMLEQVGRRRVPAPPVNKPQIPVMRASTSAERLRDTMSPVFDVLAGLGMPGARGASTTVPFSGSPTAEGAPLPTEQVLNTPMGMGMLAPFMFGGRTMPMTPVVQETARDASWMADAARRAATQGAGRSANAGRDAARVAEAIRAGGASGSRAPSGGFRPPMRPPVVEGSPQVFGPGGPPVPTMTSQGEAVVKQLLDVYQKQLASGNQAAAQKTLAELQPYLKVLMGVR